jgi:hypothetical protein
MRSARHWLARLSLLCAGVVFGAAANAGNIRGSWDPSLGGTFSGTGFSGEIVFFVPDACLFPSGYAFNTGSSCSIDNGGMQLISLELTLYDDNNPSTVFSTITFDPGQSPSPIFGVQVDTGASPTFVVGLDTDPIGPKPSDPDLINAPNNFAPASVLLQFVSGEFPGLPAGVYLYDAAGCSLDTESDVWDCSEPTSFRSIGAPVTYSAVPEPGSLALLLSAAGVGWLARRRKAAQ